LDVTSDELKSVNNGVVSVFSNCVRMLVVNSPPPSFLRRTHDLKYQEVTGHQNFTISHDKIMQLCKDHVIPGIYLFPGAGFAKIGLSAGVRLSKTVTDHDVKLMDVKFMNSFDIKEDYKLIYEHTFGCGVEFPRCLYGKVLGEIEVDKGCSMFTTCWVQAESLVGGETWNDSSSSARNISETATKEDISLNRFFPQTSSTHTRYAILCLQMKYDNYLGSI